MKKKTWKARKFGRARGITWEWIDELARDSSWLFWRGYCYQQTTGKDGKDTLRATRKRAVRSLIINHITHKSYQASVSTKSRAVGSRLNSGSNKDDCDGKVKEWTKTRWTDRIWEWNCKTTVKYKIRRGRQHKN